MTVREAVGSRPAESGMPLGRYAERNRRIIEMVRAGGTFVEVAAALGVTRNVVAGVWHRAGFSAGDRDERFRRQSAGIRRSWASGTRKPRPRLFERPSPDDLIAMRRQGLTIKQIAARHGCSTTLVERWLYETSREGGR